MGENISLWEAKKMVESRSSFLRLGMSKISAMAPVTGLAFEILSLIELEERQTCVL